MTQFLAELTRNLQTIGNGAVARAREVNAATAVRYAVDTAIAGGVLICAGGFFDQISHSPRFSETRPLDAYLMLSGLLIAACGSIAKCTLDELEEDNQAVYQPV